MGYDYECTRCGEPAEYEVRFTEKVGYAEYKERKVNVCRGCLRWLKTRQSFYGDIEITAVEPLLRLKYYAKQ